MLSKSISVGGRDDRVVRDVGALSLGSDIVPRVEALLWVTSRSAPGTLGGSRGGRTKGTAEKRSVAAPVASVRFFFQHSLSAPKREHP